MSLIKNCRIEILQEKISRYQGETNKKGKVYTSCRL